MPTATRLLVQSIKEATIVRFQEASILDANIIQQISQELNYLVEAQNKRKLLLDFSQVKFLSSAALGVLVNLRKKVEGIKGQLVISAMNKELRKIFKITNLEKMFQFSENESGALELLGVTVG